MMMSHRADRQATVLVIDDDASVRESLAELFASMGLRAETFGSVAEFLGTKVSDAPSCLVLDVRLPGLSGLDFQADLARAGIPMPIIFITGHGDIPMSVKAMKAGAVEFLTKPFRDQELLDAVQRGLELDRTRREQQKSVTELRARFDSLTPREQEVIRFVCAGLMNKQIGGELGVSEITVKVHRGNAMRKMGAKSLADLLRMAQVLGLDRPK
jgi:FixJ family two-component response regulator